MNAIRMLWGAALLGCAGALSLPARAELRVAVLQRSAVRTLTLHGEFGERGVLSMATAPAGFRFEVFEIEGRVEDETKAAGTVRAPVTVVQNGNTAKGLRTKVDDFGMHAVRTDTLMLTIPGNLVGGRTAGASRRLRFACLVDERLPVELKVGEAMVELPPASQEPFRSAAPELEARVVAAEVVETAPTATRPSVKRQDYGAGEFVIAGGRLRRTTVAWTARASKEDVDTAFFVRADYLVLVDRNGEWHTPVAVLSADGIVLEASSAAFSFRSAGESGEVVLFWRERPELEGARLVFVPEELSRLGR